MLMANSLHLCSSKVKNINIMQSNYVIRKEKKIHPSYWYEFNFLIHSVDSINKIWNLIFLTTLTNANNK